MADLDWVPKDRDAELFDRVIPEARWAKYAIHRLEFFSERVRWEPKPDTGEFDDQ